MDSLKKELLAYFPQETVAYIEAAAIADADKLASEGGKVFSETKAMQLVANYAANARGGVADPRIAHAIVFFEVLCIAQCLSQHGHWQAATVFRWHLLGNAMQMRLEFAAEEADKKKQGQEMRQLVREGRRRSFDALWRAAWRVNSGPTKPQGKSTLANRLANHTSIGT